MYLILTKNRDFKSLFNHKRIGGAGIKKVKPLVDEFRRWKRILREPYERHKARDQERTYTESR